MLDGARSLKELHLDLKAYRDVDDLEPAYACLVVIVQVSRRILEYRKQSAEYSPHPQQFLEFSAVNITKLTIETTLRKFPGGAPFFAAMPTLQELTLTCGTEEPFADSRLPDFFSTAATMQDTQITTSALRHLTLAGPSLMDANYPTFGHLKSLVLR